MSVTLKLADEDAAVVGSILRAVAKMPTETNPATDNQMYKDWFYQIRASHTGRDLSKLLEISGAFQVAVRANQR